MKTKLFSALIAVLTLTACDGEYPISERYNCRFAFNTEWHITSKLTQSLNEYNHFVKVSVSKSNEGAYYVLTSDRHGDSEKVNLTANVEEVRPYERGILMGAGAANGALILGRTNFHGYVAWDSQCPNCTTMNGSTRYPLAWTDKDTEVSCANCKRSYSLETGSVIAGNEGSRLLQYGFNYAGPGSWLIIGN